MSKKDTVLDWLSEFLGEARRIGFSVLAGSFVYKHHYELAASVAVYAVLDAINRGER